jgi:hypothetical protein
MADGFEIIAIRVETIVHERTAMLTHRRQHANAIDVLVDKGRLTAAEGAMCKRVVCAFTDDLANGLHISGAADPEGVARAMAPIIKQLSEARSDG